MLRRCVSSRYRYREFEFTKVADIPFNYPREAPNTSYFGQYFSGVHMSWGWGKEELWIDKEQRRYETTWQIFRKIAMCITIMAYIFPFGVPSMLLSWRYGDTGKNAWLKVPLPFDQNYIETGGNTLDPEWIRHIHSRESF
eukprot:PhF_6_TR5738/c0_g1_i1/m.8453